MDTLSLKVKISMLWVFMDFSLLLLLALNGLDSGGGLREMIAGFPPELIPYMLLGGATILLLPFVIAFLSIALRDSQSRRVNVVLGLIFTVFNLSGVVYGLSKLSIASAYLSLLQTATFVASVLIAWYSIRWPSQKAELSRRRTIGGIMMEISEKGGSSYSSAASSLPWYLQSRM